MVYGYTHHFKNKGSPKMQVQSVKSKHQNFCFSEKSVINIVILVLVPVSNETPGNFTI